MVRKTLTLRFLSATTLFATLGLIGCANPQDGMVSNLEVNPEDSSQIIGGMESSGQEDFSKLVVSLYNLAEGSICTASILSDTILLTAAHCVDGRPSDLRVVFGTDLEAQNIIVKPVQAYKVSPIWTARQNETLNTGDIALVKFSGGLPAGFKPVKMVSSLSQLRNDQKTLLAGYGTSNGKEGTGAGRLRFVETTIKNLNYSQTEILVEQSQGKGACHGDSGGPAYLRVGNELFVWGVTSRGVNDPRNDCSVSAAYTSVPYYSAWISRTMTALNSGNTRNGRNRSILAASGF